ncbi:hypothetical protein VP01_740g1 [Puccinia sorghi]|uniref:Uncharacterized protein n=1 Tax=Puccinia sorghi TaxID=27349 RepID=A0A0L6UDE7_9BASI|nr:hypothetical protein VP01_740g1 [Puccinia sorghi]
MNVDKSLASEPPSICQSNSIRTAKTIIHKTPFSINRLNYSQQPQSLKLNKTNTTLPNNKNLVANQTFTYCVMIKVVDNGLLTGGCTKLQRLEIIPPVGTPLASSRGVGGWISQKPTHTRAWKANQIFCPSHSSFFPSLEDEPIPLPLSLNPVFKSAKATVSSFCLCVFLNYREQTPLPTAGLPSSQWSVQNHNMLYIIQLNSPLGYSSKHCDCIIAKGFFYLGGGLHEIKLSCNQLTKELYSPQIRLKLCTTYNQHTAGISSLYDQVQRKHFHESQQKATCRNCLVRHKGSPLYLARQCVHIAFTLCLVSKCDAKNVHHIFLIHNQIHHTRSSIKVKQDKIQIQKKEI